jgi:hypothetical protein
MVSNKRRRRKGAPRRSRQPSPTPADTLEEFDRLVLGDQLWLVLIDDAEFHGTEAASLPSGSLSEAGGIIWAAVFVPPEQTSSVTRELCERVLHPYASRHGVDELHFGDIYQGRKAFRNVDIAERLEIVTAAADFLDERALSVRFMRLGPHENPPADAFPPGLNIRDRKVVALWTFLQMYVGPYIVAHRASEDHRAVVYVDEWKSQDSEQVRRFIVGGGLADPFQGDRVQLGSSTQIHAVQLADFVASSFAYVVRRIEAGGELFELHEQALRVLTHQEEGGTHRRILVTTDESGHRCARVLELDEEVPDCAEPFPWDTRPH